jgi:PAS domain S-box-containing protein
VSEVPGDQGTAAGKGNRKAVAAVAALSRFRSTWNSFNRLGPGIGLRLFIRVLLFSCAITLILTLVQLYLGYRHDVRAIETRMSEIGVSYLQSLGEGLWNVDSRQLALQIEGILRLPAIRFVEVRETTDRAHPILLSGGHHAIHAALRHEFPISYTSRGERQQLGVLSIEATLNDVYRALFDTAIVILVSQGATIFLVSFFILYITHRLITRRLTALARFLRKYDLRQPPPPLRLPRREPGDEDELDQLVAAFEKMRQSLEGVYNDLRESETRFREIFESTGVTIWEQDFSQVKMALDDLKATGVRDFRQYFATHQEFVYHAEKLVRMVDVNDTGVKLFAAASKQDLLASYKKTYVLPETREAFVNTLVGIAEGRASLEAETIVQTLKGERLTVLFNITFPPPSAQLDTALVTVTDITERKRAEYLTGHVFETAPDAIYIVGRDYRFQRVNAAFARRFRLPAEKIVGMRMDELGGAEPFAETYKPNLDRCFAGQQVSFAGWFPTPSGRLYLAATYSPLRPDSVGVEAVLVITRDFTDLAQASDALQDTQAELAHVTRVTALGELTASIAHEVNQPLAAIVADATASLNWLAANTPDLDRAKEALEAIVKDGHRAADVIQRIRGLATKAAPQKVRLDVNELIRDVVPLIGPEVRSHEVSLRLDLAPALPPVAADRVQLQQVLINFVMNGIQAMDSVDRRRELVIRSRPHEADHVLVAVQDAGVGIDSSKMDELFTAFFTTKPGGMGMGLSISRSIIEAHGGRIWATPNPDHGATFQFALPTDSDRTARV